METRFILGFIFFGFAFFVSLLNLYVCFRLVMKMTRYDDVALLKSNNIAASLVVTGSFIAMAIMARNALYPINAVLQDFWFLSDKNYDQMALILGRSLGYLLVTYVLSLISIGAALFLFQKLTREFDEEVEIQNNNIAVGFLLSGVLVAFALLIESGIGNFVNTLIPLKDMNP
jgi:uncharacterized membrane protein YjfL (UPF0719 family)